MANEYEYQWWWKYGRPRDIWTVYQDIVKKIIKVYGLEVAKPENLPLRMEFEAAQVFVVPMAKAKALKPQPFPGGMRIPHLHYARDVYLVTEEQWQAISQKFIGTFQNKLSKAKNVSFEQIMALSEAVDSM